MAVTITTTTAVKRSWADIVKGQFTAETTCTPSMAPSELEEQFAADMADESSLKPGKRGQRRCLCQGEVLVMLGHYGWIMTFDPIDHPDVSKTAGRVYVHKRDVAKGEWLGQGDTVSFYLYADDQGLGAEGVTLEQRAASDHYSEEEDDLAFEQGDSGYGWNTGAVEFVPVSSTKLQGFNVEATEFVPSFNAQAMEFVSGKLSMGAPDVPEFVPGCKEFGTSGKCAMTFLGIEINPAFLSDDESDDESTVCDDNSSGRDSTAACSSESEEEESTPSLTHIPVRPPPGLTLQPGFRPPPGLELFVEAA